MIEPLWKIVSLLMSLVAFSVVGWVSLSSGSDLLWVAVRSVLTFVVCWMVLSNLGGVLSAILPTDDDGSAAGESTAEKGADKEG